MGKKESVVVIDYNRVSLIEKRESEREKEGECKKTKDINV